MPARGTGAKPITSSAFYILLALVDEERHGLGIIDDIERRSGGEVAMGPGTLYHSIQRLVAAGLIEEAKRRPAPPLDDPRRRYYRITRRGKQTVVAEAARLDRVLRIARDKRLLSS